MIYLNKKQIAITLGVMCFLLTIAICVQLRTMSSASSTVSQILPDNVLTFVIEASSSQSWYKYVKNSDCLFTIDSFGSSGRREDVLRKYGFTIDKIQAKIESMIK